MDFHSYPDEYFGPPTQHLGRASTEPRTELRMKIPDLNFDKHLFLLFKTPVDL